MPQIISFKTIERANKLTMAQKRSNIPTTKGKNIFVSTRYNGQTIQETISESRIKKSYTQALKSLHSDVETV